MNGTEPRLAPRVVHPGCQVTARGALFSSQLAVVRGGAAASLSYRIGCEDSSAFSSSSFTSAGCLLLSLPGQLVKEGSGGRRGCGCGAPAPPGGPAPTRNPSEGFLGYRHLAVSVVRGRGGVSWAESGGGEGGNGSQCHGKHPQLLLLR